MLIILFVSGASCIQKSEKKSPDKHLNIQEMIDYEPEMLAPGIISRASFEGHASITPDGKEIYFTSVILARNDRIVFISSPVRAHLKKE